MFKELLREEFAPYGDLSEDQLGRLEHHYRLLAKWNQKINLTRIRRLADIVQLHYCESLFLGRALPPGRLRIVDIGSGAGFPGIPVAILRSDSLIDLIESHQRKAVFLRETTRDLPNVRVLCQRAGSCDHNYDWAIARAVRPAGVTALNLARNMALLVSSRDAARIAEASFIQKIPWGDSRSLVLFHVEHVKI